MRITQGTFSFLPDLTDEEIEKQIAYALSHNWAIMVEYTDDPHPRNYLWEMWKQPEFDLEPDDADQAMEDVHACRKAYPNHYIKVVCYDRSLGNQTSKLAFLVNRPKEEPGFRLDRQEKRDRQIHYTVYAYVHDQAVGRRYGNEADLGTGRDAASIKEATPDRAAVPEARQDGGSAENGGSGGGEDEGES